MELSNDPIKINCDSRMLEQILLNLCFNAITAMPDGGEITISTNLMNHEANGEPETNMGNGKMVAEMQLMDNGIGMDLKTRARIFEPSFSNWDGNKGVGLGMTIVQDIVKQHKGWVWVESEVGHGATVVIRIPLNNPKENMVVSN